MIPVGEILDFTLACDIMLDLEGSIRPAMYLADALVEKGYKVAIISPIMSRAVEQHLRTVGLEPINLHARLFAKFDLSMLWFEAWAREALFRLNSRHLNRGIRVTINFSHTLIAPSEFWYLQGPTSSGLRDMRNYLSTAYTYAYKLLKPALEYADKKLSQAMCSKSKFVLANSKFCASLYRDWNIEACDIIYPPINCKLFKPQTSRSSGDYAVTYFGRETIFSVIRAIADQGVKIKAFGSKAQFIPKSILTNPNIDFLGKIPVNKLVDLYSNASFTLFPFTHEPFGYIPVESMSCGTPTLTFGVQGPKESIVDGYTGWLVQSSDEMISRAIELWKNGYTPKIRQNCVKEAARFDKSVYVRRWFETIQRFQSCGINCTL
jgi:glycosyltransferase involved in cell wall biosynthesis